MRIGVLRSQVPFVTGGAELQSANLVAALNARGHEAVEITLPFKWYPPQVLADHILAAKLIDLSEVEGVPTDMVIGLKFPAWLAPHPNKLFWVIHQHRQAYDLWETGHSDLLDAPDGAALRQLIHEEDRAALTASPHPIFAESRNVAHRLTRHLGISAEPLYHPPPNAARIRQGGTGDYLFAPGRINPSKRLDLILRALAAAEARIPLVVAGVAENPAYQDRLMALARELGVEGQVTWLGRVDDATLQRSYAEARAVVFVPRDEDYGYITLEAMLAGKPVITVSDAGGPLEFVSDGRHGLVTAPKPAALGGAFTRLMQDPALAETMGQAGHARYHGMGIGWDKVVETLTGQAPGPVAPDAAPPRSARPAAAGSETPSEDPALRAASRLEQAVAPGDPGLAATGVEDLLAGFEFEELPRAAGRADDPEIGATPRHAAGLAPRWAAIRAALAEMGGLAPTRALDLGAVLPPLLQAGLAMRFPGIALGGIRNADTPYRQSVRARRAEWPDFELELLPRGAAPEAGSWDLVTAMDPPDAPSHALAGLLAQAARALRPGGHLLLTAPNATSHGRMARMLEGAPPGRDGLAAAGLATLCRQAGFEIVTLRAVDPEPVRAAPSLAEWLVARGDALELRGEMLLCLARRGEGEGQQGPTPPGALAAAAIRLEEHEAQTGLLRIALENPGPGWWPLTGPAATLVLACWLDADGVLRHRQPLQPLTEPLGPGETRRVSLRLDPPGAGQGPEGTLLLTPWRPASGAEGPELRLPCTEAAFLHLVRTAPLAGEER